MKVTEHNVDADWKVEELDALMELKGEDICWEDEVNTIADDLTSIYTSELAAWIAENGSRASYHDEAIIDGLINDGATLWQRLAIAQAECIRSMAYRIVQKLKLI